jgi:Flp pilus assembly protein TadG
MLYRNTTTTATQTTPRGRRRPRANATLELVLALGILLNLTFGTIEFGHFFFVKNTLQGAAREGSRAAISAAATNAEVTSTVNASLNAAGFNTAKYTIQIRNAADTANVDVATQAAGTGILVKVSGTWGTVGLRPLGLINSSKKVLGAAVMRKEGA